MNKIKTWVWAVISAVFGFVIGILVGPPTSNGNLAGGDISKVSKFQKNTVSAEMSAFQERMLNNKDELNTQVASLIVLNSRLTDFDNLLSLTGNVAEGRIELSEPADALKKLSVLSENARQSSHDALISFDQLLDRNNRSGIAYEQTTQNATLGFLKIERQVSCGKKFVLAADEYLKKNGMEGNEDLAVVRDLWQDFCQVDAILNSDNDEAQYWAGVDKSIQTLSNAEVAPGRKAFESMSDVLRNFSGTQMINMAIVQSGSDVIGVKPTVTSVIGNSVSAMDALNLNAASLGNLTEVPFMQAINAFQQLGNGIAQQRLGATQQNALDNQSKTVRIGVIDQTVLGAAFSAQALQAVNEMSAQLNGAFQFGQLNMVDQMTQKLGFSSQAFE